MNDQQLAAERAAWEVWAANDAEHGGYISKLDFLAGYRAALAQREPVAEGEVTECVAGLRAEYKPYAANLLERTEAARQAADQEKDQWFKTAIRIEKELTAERARSEKLVEALRKYEQD